MKPINKVLEQKHKYEQYPYLKFIDTSEKIKMYQVLVHLPIIT